jgi:hypothetical protein
MLSAGPCANVARTLFPFLPLHQWVSWFNHMGVTVRVTETCLLCCPLLPSLALLHVPLWDSLVLPHECG